MKCEICTKEFEPKHKRHFFCSVKCRDKSKYQKHRQKIIDRSIKYYKDNREDVLKKQNTYQEKKKKEDKDFRKLKNFRRLSAKKISLIGKSCEKCGATKDLHRHHEDYNKPDKAKILCRKCHNKSHF